MRVSEKIKQLRKQKGLTQTEFGKLLGVQKNAVSKWECGRVDDIPTSKIKAMASIFGVPVSYLVDDYFSDLPANGIAIDSLDFVSFPVLGTISAGYDGLAVEEMDGNTEMVPRSALRGRPAEDFFVLLIKGRSMWPKMEEGDRLLVERCTSVDSGSLAVVLYADDYATVKRVNYVSGEDWMELVPINPEFAPIRIEDEELERCRVLGKPVMLLRNFD